jgi:hypothetical protein
VKIGFVHIHPLGGKGARAWIENVSPSGDSVKSK